LIRACIRYQSLERFKIELFPGLLFRCPTVQLKGFSASVWIEEAFTQLKMKEYDAKMMTEYFVSVIYALASVIALYRLAFVHGIPCSAVRWGRKRLVLAQIAAMCTLRAAEGSLALRWPGGDGAEADIALALDRLAICVWFSLLSYVLLQW
jgi:hypothetical protein